MRIAIGHLVACLPVFVALAGCSAPAPPRAAEPSATRAFVLRPPPPEQVSAVVLRDWDSRRAAAYAAGSVTTLRRLYVPRSTAGRADAALLQSYLDRGLVVSGMRMQVLALAELTSSDKRIRLQVTDRLVGAVARGPAGEVALPRDSPTTRTVTLRKAGGEWLMASVR